MPMVKVPAGTDALHPEATEGWQHPLHPASVKREWPVPESPLIGRTFTRDNRTYMILRVFGNKTERNRTPENCPRDRVTGEPRLNDYSVSVTAAEVWERHPLELGLSRHFYVSLSAIERINHGTPAE